MKISGKEEIKRMSKRKWRTLESTKFEKIHNEIFKNSDVASKVVAHEIAELIRYKNKIHSQVVV